MTPALSAKAQEILATMQSSERGHYLLPKRIRSSLGEEDDTDELYLASRELIAAGLAYWLPGNSTFAPGIRLRQ